MKLFNKAFAFFNYTQLLFLFSRTRFSRARGGVKKIKQVRLGGTCALCALITNFERKTLEQGNARVQGARWRKRGKAKGGSSLYTIDFASCFCIPLLLFVCPFAAAPSGTNTTPLHMKFYSPHIRHVII
jgi:hypothetical protein